ncbi:MAG TPA: HNH endonuclease [Gammaproteobacteria bacterium]|nr:HNH endonuclease [Gammaproteobacteria bacterium]
MDDLRVRRTAFEWLAEQVRLHGDVLPRNLLAQGFTLDGVRVPLLGPQGIFKPQVLPEIPLSITTVPSGPYDDGFSTENLLLYRYRGTDPRHRDNVGLREAMRQRIPLIYFHRVVEGKYLAVWPVFIVGDDPGRLTFKVEVDDVQYARRSLAAEPDGPMVRDEESGIRRAYITATVRQRVHQRAFRERVLDAYRDQCALCRLRHEELLDAAHIIPDGEPDGEPIVPNGLALCKLHHAAFDRQFLGIRPDYVVEVRRDILEESDGPMLLHGLKEMHQLRLHVPRRATDRPSEMLLERRYKRFLLLQEG